jgi:F-type H+-transporting ATPase subunit epsilon
MAGSFQLDIVTPDRKFFEGEVEMVIVRTAEGDVGVLKDHEPLVAPVAIGAIRIKKSGDKFEEAACSGGFMTVTEGKTTILTDAAEWAHEIDIERAKRAKYRAEELLAKGAEREIDVVRARGSLTRAMNRLRVAGSED